MPLTKEQLLNPRYKVIADYPKSVYRVWDVINAGTTSEDCIYCDREGPRMRHYPHLFQPLPWWSDRKIFELPEYVICIKTPDQKIMPGMVLKIAWCAENWGTDHVHAVMLDTNCYEPATEEEYTACINQKNNN